VGWGAQCGGEGLCGKDGTEHCCCCPACCARTIIFMYWHTRMLLCMVANNLYHQALAMHS
jgi:hypothetical protein